MHHGAGGCHCRCCCHLEQQIARSKKSTDQNFFSMHEENGHSTIKAGQGWLPEQHIKNRHPVITMAWPPPADAESDYDFYPPTLKRVTIASGCCIGVIQQRGALMPSLPSLDGSSREAIPTPVPTSMAEVTRNYMLAQPPSQPQVDLDASIAA